MTREWRDAVDREDLEALTRQLAEGADVDARDEHGQTALMLASRDGRARAVELLVARGAALNCSAKYHLTPLMLAVIRSHADVVGILLDAGADVHRTGTGAPGFSGKTALDLAEGIGDAAVVGLLKSKVSPTS